MLNRLQRRLPLYAKLMRLDRPIGIYLLLWPCLWALWLAAEGPPDWALLVIFVAGTVLMRSAGCVINDFADRHIDPHVQRTKERPLATGEVSEREALTLLALLCLLAFALVLLTNRLTVALSFGALALAACYPFMKRYTHLPQLVLGAAFSFSIPMAFSAQRNALPESLWLLYLASLLWTVAYDTFYAMVDRDEDVLIGVKSTAILFGRYDRMITACLQIATLLLLVLTGFEFNLGYCYFTSIALASLLFIRQQVMIRTRDRDACFQAFLNNHYVGAIIFVGLALDYQI
jgi:4-hydroxybenzoate polyprenyltransferase